MIFRKDAKSRNFRSELGIRTGACVRKNFAYEPTFPLQLSKALPLQTGSEHDGPAQSRLTHVAAGGGEIAGVVSVAGSVLVLLIHAGSP